MHNLLTVLLAVMFFMAIPYYQLSLRRYNAKLDKIEAGLTAQELALLDRLTTSDITYDANNSFHQKLASKGLIANVVGLMKLTSVGKDIAYSWYDY